MIEFLSNDDSFDCAAISLNGKWLFARGEKKENNKSFCDVICRGSVPPPKPRQLFFFFLFFLPAAASTSLSARFFARRLDPLEMAVFLSPGERLKGISKSGGGGVGEARWRAPK